MVFVAFPAQVNQFRQLYSKVINDKHDDVMAKFGAILAQGILDAGQCFVSSVCVTDIWLQRWDFFRKLVGVSVSVCSLGEVCVCWQYLQGVQFQPPYWA